MSSSTVVVSRDLSNLLLKQSSLDTSQNVEVINNDFLTIINDPKDVPEPWALSMAVVLEELADQLDVLGRSIGGPEIELRSKPSIEMDKEAHRGKPDNPRGDGDSIGSQESVALPERYLLKQHYASVLPRRIMQGVEGPSTTYTRRLSQAIKGSYLNTLTSNGKLMVDRAYLQKAIQDLMIDVIQRSSLSSLIDCIDTENANKAEMRRLAMSGVKHKVLMNQLKRDIKLAKKEKILESNRYERLIWGLEDDTQELLTRTGLEHAYMKKTGKMISQRSAKQCQKIEDEFSLELANAKLDLKNEYHAHASMTTALKKKLIEITAKQEFWMDKYDNDKEHLQNELDTMKENRAKDIEHINWLKHMIYNYNQIVQDERRIRGIEEERIERTELQIKRATKIQAWWRGEMVRKKLGPFRPVKKKKEKKDKKDKKNKKK